MRPSALVFLAVLVAAAAAWALAVLPIHREAYDAAGRIFREDIAARVAASADPGPSAEEARRLEEALARLRPAGAAEPPPSALAADGPGALAGKVPWEEVPAVLAWASSQPRTVLEIEVRALPEDPARAACRVVLGQ